MTSQFEMLVDIHDRCMVATTQFLVGRGLNVNLMTADQSILKSGLVPTIWQDFCGRSWRLHSSIEHDAIGCFVILPQSANA